MKSQPEEELAIGGADIMVLGWTKIYRKQYPKLSLTLDLRASDASDVRLASAKRQLAPVGSETSQAERKLFVYKFGYEPLQVKVATGSVGLLGETTTS